MSKADFEVHAHWLIWGLWTANVHKSRLRSTSRMLVILDTCPSLYSDILWYHYFNSQGSLILHFYPSNLIKVCIVKLWKSQKHHWVPPLIWLKFYVWAFDHKNFKIWVFFPTFFFSIFTYAGGPQRNFDVKYFNFFEKMLEITLLGLGKYKKEQSHEVWWT